MDFIYTNNITEIIAYYPKYLSNKTFRIENELDLHPNSKLELWKQDLISAKNTLEILKDYKFYTIVIVNNNIKIIKYNIEDFKYDDRIERFFKSKKLQNGMFIINTTNKILLEKIDYKKKTFIPIFSLYENINSYEIPLPLEDIKYNYKKYEGNKNNSVIYHSLKYKNSNLEFIDKRIQDINDILKDEDNSDEYRNLLTISKDLKFDEKYSNVLIICNPENIYNIYDSIANNQFIIFIESDYKYWFEYLLEEGTNFIKVRSDLKDLKDKLLWCYNNPEICQKLASDIKEIVLKAIIQTKNYLENTLTLINNKESNPLTKTFEEYPPFISSRMYTDEELLVNSTIKKIYKTRKVEGDSGLKPLQAAINPREGIFLYDLIKDNNYLKCLEIGMANGLSGLYICQALKENKEKVINKDKEAYLVSMDPFQKEQWDNAAINHIKSAGLSNFSIYVKEKSYNGMPKILNQLNNEEIQPFDLIFIDGMHLFDYTLIDFFYADLLLRKGGVIVLDDIKHPNVKACLNYIKTNYAHYKILNTISSSSAAVFHKIDDDKRDWDFHKPFMT
jgi:predicted O-methyltransferase YrrM